MSTGALNKVNDRLYSLNIFDLQWQIFSEEPLLAAISTTLFCLCQIFFECHIRDTTVVSAKTKIFHAHEVVLMASPDMLHKNPPHCLVEYPWTA